MLDTVDFNHVQHISFTQSRLTDAVSVILSELLSYEHPPKIGGVFLHSAKSCQERKYYRHCKQTSYGCRKQRSDRIIGSGVIFLGKYRYY